jgi:23S rRNA (cytosine1962-C5)-methyltransferase
VTSVDASSRYLGQARRNFELNDIAPAAHEFVAGDCFTELDRFKREGRRYDIVLMDPPSFSSTRRSRFATGGGTAGLVEKALGLLDSGGLLITSSNLQKMGLAEYLKELRRGSLAADRTLQIVEVAGQAPDFPFLPTFPEGQYLKYLVSVVKEKF